MTTIEATQSADPCDATAIALAPRLHAARRTAAAEQVAFARCFGELEAFPFGKPGRDPDILEIVHRGFLRHESLGDRETGEPLPAEAGRALVRELQQQHARPEYRCRFARSPGAVSFWDDRAVQHYAVSDCHPERRVLRRVTVRGDRPYYAAGRDPLDVASSPGEGRA